MSVIEHSRLIYDCPDGEVCKRCPCADEDDVCFPGERLRAEYEALAKQHRGAVAALDEIAGVLDRGIPDDRKLATVVRLVNAARGHAPVGGQSDLKVTMPRDEPPA